MASSTVPRGLHVLADRCFDLQSADFLCFFIRKRRWAYIVCIGFSNAEYRIALVDFIVALRRTKGRRRRTLRSPSPPSSGLHLLTPGDPLRRGILAAAVDRDIGSLYPVQTVYPHFDVSFGCLVFGLRSLAFQKISSGFSLSFFIGGGRDCSCLRLRVGLAVVYRLDYR